MYRRSVCGLCRSYHIPPLSRVGIFPIHLDPPTQQHREIFKLLLGMAEVPSPLSSQVAPSASTASAPLTSSHSPGTTGSVSDADGGGVVVANSRGAEGGLAGGSSGPAARMLPAKFWYLESFAESLSTDSQLAPFDDLILIPNTRYPVSLRQSTHLAALSVLAARGIPRVHVDFTALEHPDDSMPVIYELAQRYHNSVLVHWLHDAYEMLNWRNFSEIKMYVPLLLLQTNSLPISAVTKPPPPIWAPPHTRDGDAQSREDTEAAALSNGAAAPPTRRPSLLRSRLYQDPKRVKDGHFAEYYAKAAGHMRAQLQYREQRNHPALQRQQQENPLRHPADRDQRVGGGMAGSGAVHPGHWLPDTAGSAAGHVGTAGQASSVQETPAAVSDVDKLVRGEWWLTKGGRGDDRVEVSRSYSNAASSSWLGAPTPLGGKRMGIDVTADTMLSEEEADARRGRWHVGADEGGAVTTHPDRVHANAAEWRGDDDVGPGEEDEREKEVCPAGLHADNTDSDFIITGEGLLEVTRGQRQAAAAASEPETAAASPAPPAQTTPTPLPTEEAGAEVEDPHTPQALFKEFAEVRASLEEMLEPTQVCQHKSPPPAREAVSSSPPDAKSSTDRTGPTAAHPSENADGKLTGRKERRVLDPNSVVSRRKVRELLEEIYPVLYFTRLHHRQMQQQQRQQQQLRQDVRSVDASLSHGANGASTATSGAAAVKESVSNAAAALLAGRPYRGAAAQADALLDEVALLQQSGATSSSSVSSTSATAPAACATTTAMAETPLLPMVEVHPVTRCTGADVRHVLWDQDVSPAMILTGAVAKYVESHGLYRDTRKNADGVAGGNHVSGYSSLLSPGTETGGAGLGPCAGGGGGHRPSAGGSMLGAGDRTALDVTGSTSSATHANVSALKRMMLQKEHAVMSFAGIIPRLELHYDKNNLLAREQYEKLKVFQCQDAEAPDLIVPIGGDGYMMHCIRNNWRRFIPFYGVNAGHVGYLLNDCATLEELFSSPLKLHTSNMLYCQAEKETETGERVLLSELAFNDAWVERSSGQTALIRILINGEERIRRLRGDGVLVSTAAGSTAYSQALGASPVPVGAPLIQVVGSNVVSPAQWRPVHLDQEDQVEFEVIDNIKRPCRCFVDSVNVGNVTRMLVRSSRVAGVTLAFSRSCDLQHKLYQVQFPKTL